MDKERITFHWYDYVLFTTWLGLSAAIDIYFGFFGKKQSTVDEYLKGGKRMKVLPISMSQISTYISGVMILAIPVDTYFNGTTFAWSLLSIFLVGVTMPLIYLPVFYNMQLTSVYEYLESRFNSRIRKLSSLLFALSSCLYLPLVTYVPAIAIAQATDVQLHLIAVIVCGVCLFYTTIGGIKAVVWTDALQCIAMVGGIMGIMVIGIIDVGGFSEIYIKNKETGRFDWDLHFTPFKRDTIWSAAIGMSVHTMPYICVNQGSIQKYLSLPSMRDANIALTIFLIGQLLIKSSCFLIGVTIYAKYYACDPLSTGEIKKHDQLLPYFAMDVAGKIPGLPGLFISGIFCAALSNLSSVTNSLGATIYEDFVASFMPKDITQKKVSSILKLIVFLIGIIATSLVFVIERLGGLLPLIISFGGLTGGTLLGVFTIGMLMPFVNSKGILSGMITSLFLMICLIIPTQLYRYNGYLKDEHKPLNVHGCQQNYTLHFTPKSNSDSFEPWIIFKTSPFYYTLVGFLIVLVVSVPVSWCTKKNEVEPDLISPLSRWFLSKRNEERTRNNVIYHSVPNIMKIIEI